MPLLWKLAGRVPEAINLICGDAMGVNKVILVGNLGRDPEVRYTNDQTAVATFSVATNERKKDASGQWGNHTEWHRVVAFGKLADFARNYLKKGKQIYVEGRLRTNKWQDKEGHDRYTTEIIAAAIQFVGGRESEGGYQAQAAAESGAGGHEPVHSADALSDAGGDEPPAFDDDDIPF